MWYLTALPASTSSVMDARSAAMAAEVDAAPVDGSAASDGRVKGRSSNRDCNDPGVASNSSVDREASRPLKWTDRR